MARQLASELDLPEQFRTRSYLRSVVRACKDGLQIFAKRLNDGVPPDSVDLERLGWAGATQAELGVGLDVLLRAYRLAARVVWDDVVASSLQGPNIKPETLVALTEQVLEYLDEISVVVSHSYMETRERLLRQKDRDRELILRRLVSGDIPSDLEQLAAAVGLELTPPYQILLFFCPDEAALSAVSAAAATRGFLSVVTGPSRIVILTPATRNPSDTAAELVSDTGKEKPGQHVAIAGKAAALTEVAGKVFLAERMLKVGMLLAPDEVIHTQTDLGLYALMLDQPEEVAQFIEETLGPLAQAGTGKQQLLRDTLSVHLTSSTTTAAAEKLNIHRHTLIYRMEQLSRLLPVPLHDSISCHRLWLALQLYKLEGLNQPRPGTPYNLTTVSSRGGRLRGE